MKNAGRKDAAVVRQRLVFTGTVQGVGFRYRAKYAASLAGVTGWVTNEWDGSVIMEAQGTAEQLERLLVQINKSPFIHIDGLARKEIPTEEHETGFHVR